MISKIDERALAIYCAVQVAVGEMLNNLRERGENGQTMVEYALIIALIAVVVIGVVTLLGGKIKSVFNSILNGL